MNRPYSEATRDMIAENEGKRRNGAASDGRGWYRTDAEREDCYAIADAALDALAEAGLLTEPAEVEAAAKVQRDQARANALMDVGEAMSPTGEWPPEALDEVIPAVRKMARELAAGLLLPEGAETRTEWRVTGDPGEGFPPYSFTWSPAVNPQLGDSERAARRFVDALNSLGGWPDGPHLSRRTVAEMPWDAVRLAVGDSKPTQDHVTEENDHAR